MNLSEANNYSIIEYVSVLSYIDPGVELLTSSKIWFNLEFAVWSTILSYELNECQNDDVAPSSGPWRTLNTGHLHVGEMFFNNQLMVTRINYK